MARPIWAGTLSFGLLNIPVSLMPGERKSRISFRMLDARDKAAVRYDRVNAETGEQVPWKDIVKAYEYEKDKYVVLEPDDLKSAAPSGKEAVEIEAFVDEAAIPPQYFEKPYVLTPGKKAEKGYVLLRQTLKSTGKIGIGRVVIRAREYLCAVMPQGDALLLLLLRFEEELVDVSEYKLPAGNAGEYRVSEKELAMAKQLIGSMADKWQPDKFHDEFEARLGAVIKKRLKTKGAIASVDKKSDVDEDATTNVVDFMSLLQKSLASNKRTPAKAGKPATRKAAKAPAKAAAKSAAAKKPAARRSA
jgi:DNA end-binding protein Ku